MLMKVVRSIIKDSDCLEIGMFCASSHRQQ